MTDPLNRHRLKRRAALTLGAAAAVLFSAGPVRAQADYPNKAIKVIVPFSPGGAVDGPMRAIAEHLAKRLKQQVTVENRPGAGSTIGSGEVAKAPADGYTLLLASQTNAISASLYPRLPFNPVEDFVGISLLGREPGVLVVHPSVPVNTVAELRAYVKARPGQINYSSSGNGSGQHLFMAMFASMADIKPVHVPYKGSAQAVTDLLGGTVQMSIPGTQAMVKHVKVGKLKALATTGVTRSPSLPDVPTLAESGLPGYSAYVWMGLLAPKGTPQPIIDRLQRELKAVLATPEVSGFMNEAGIEMVGSTPAEMDAYFRDERNRWARIVKETGATVD